MEAASIIAAHIKASRSTSELHVPTPKSKTPRQGFSPPDGGTDTPASGSGWTILGVRAPQSSAGSIGSISTYLMGLFVWVRVGGAAYHQCLSMSQADSIESRSPPEFPAAPHKRRKELSCHHRAALYLPRPGQTTQHCRFCSLLCDGLKI